MVRQLSSELAKVAKEELNENPKRVQDDLQHLKDWISKQPHLIARTDDQWLIALLRGCKFSLERVKKKLDLFYTLKSTAADITLRLKPTDLKFLEFLRLGTCFILPESKTLMPRVIVIRPGAFDPEKNSVSDMLCIFYYLVQILVLESDTSTVLGTKIIVDYKGVGTGHLTEVTAALPKKMVAITQVDVDKYSKMLNIKGLSLSIRNCSIVSSWLVQLTYFERWKNGHNDKECIPLRLKGSHHVNMSSIIDMVFTVVKSLINEKARQRLKIHRSYEDLMNDFPKEILPAEYGGTGGTIAEISEYWVNKFIEYKSWMQQEEQLGTDESKRPGKAQTAEDMFGLDGSFRKLEID